MLSFVKKNNHKWSSHKRKHKRALAYFYILKQSLNLGHAWKKSLSSLKKNNSDKKIWNAFQKKLKWTSSFKTGFPKVGQVAPLGTMTDTQGATSSKEGGMCSKGFTGGPCGHNLNLTLDIVQLQMKRKKRF